MRLRVSPEGRFLVRDNGQPFFYLGDTAWQLFHRLTREEMERYLKDRAAKGFTVIQAVALAELDGLGTPNAYGDVALENNDPTRPNERYFQHVDFGVRKAAELGLHIGMLPTWGDKVNRKWGVGPEVFTPENAETYGRFLGARYRNAPIIWILGGDRPIEKPLHREIWRAMAAGLRAGDGGAHLITYHPMGGQSSADMLHEEPWLDFNMLQSGHSRRNTPNYEMIARDYARTPVKPCMDGEPCYEDHPVNWKEDDGYFEAWDVRKAAYWALFAGAHGHTYGAQPIWQMWAPPRQKVSFVRRTWQEALDLPGGSQVRFAKELLLSRPFLSRIPDQSLIAGDPGHGAEHIRATRDSRGKYAMVYLPVGQPVSVRTDLLGGRRLRAWWFDPRTGESRQAGTYEAKGVVGFVPPSSGEGQDWVLVLDDVAARFPAPGSVARRRAR